MISIQVKLKYIFCTAAVILLAESSAAQEMRSVEIKFRPVEGAAGYDIQWLRTETGDSDAGEGEVERINSPPVIRNLPVEFEYFRIRSVDGRGVPGPWSPPGRIPEFISSRSLFRKIAVNGTDRLYFTGSNILLESHDAASGPAAVYWSINGSGFEPFTAAVELPAENQIVLRFYSEDRAGNRENIRQMEFWTDRIAPETKVEFTSPTALINGRMFSSGKIVLRISPLDAGSGVEKTFCKLIQNTEERVIEDCGKSNVEINIAADSVIFEYYSVDRLGNRENPKRIYLGKKGSTASLLRQLHRNAVSVGMPAALLQFRLSLRLDSVLRPELPKPIRKTRRFFV